MAKAKDTRTEVEAIAFKTLDLVEELFIEAVEELKAIRRLEVTNWSRYETLRDEAMQGLNWCEMTTQRANPTGPNVGTRQVESQPRSPAETG